MHGRARYAERGLLLLPARPADHAAGLPVPHDLPLRPSGHGADVILDADGAQHLHRVGMQGNAGFDLPELGGRLVDRRLDARPRQRVCRRQPADASADDRDACHVRPGHIRGAGYAPGARR